SAALERQDEVGEHGASVMTTSDSAGRIAYSCLVS
ncbi:MAG: hypothetical protein QOH27_996, partial [Mycobacterium sp.]|nr:hypothetical protein [Mycobacterium sp.]